MSDHHITKATSVYHVADDGLNDSSGGKLVIDANAYLLSGSQFGATLGGLWTITVNGILGSYVGLAGLYVNTEDVFQLTVGKGGSVFARHPSAGEAVAAAGAANITNHGVISGHSFGIDEIGNTADDYRIVNSGLIEGVTLAGIIMSGSGTHRVTNTGTIQGAQFSIIANPDGGADIVMNSGKLIGDISLLDGNDTVTNFIKTGKVLKHGSIDGIVDLGDGTDTFNGGNRAETVMDGNGLDTINLGAGNDTYIGTGASGADDNDAIDGGKGIDTYSAESSNQSLFINLGTDAALDINPHTAFGLQVSGQDAGTDGTHDTVLNFENAIGGSASDYLVGGSGANRLEGRDGADTIFGQGGNDVLLGGDGTDIIFGATGSDTIEGGADNDSIHGGLGKDFLTGNSGSDHFIFDIIADSRPGAAKRDVITDFEQFSDKIDLTAIDPSLALVAANFGRGEFTGAGHELRFFHTGDSTVISADVNGDKQADFQIELKGFYNILASDFV